MAVVEQGGRSYRQRQQALPRRSTGSSLRPIAQAIVEGLNLEGPTAQCPGHWKTDDQFLSVNAGLLKHDIKHPTQPLRALVSFDASDVRELAQEAVRREFPDYDSLDGDSKRDLWSKVLRVSKQVRTERVRAIVDELLGLGIELDTQSITVHRVSSTFSLTLSLRQVQQLQRVRARGYLKIRRIGVQTVA